MRATVVMEDGASLDEGKVRSAIEGKRLQFISLEETTVKRPKAAYVLAVSGAT